MCPCPTAGVGKIIRIRTWSDAPRFWLNHLIGDVMCLGISDRSLFIRKPHFDLSRRIWRRLPAHQAVRLCRGLTRKLKNPAIAAADRCVPARLRSCFAWFIDSSLQTRPLKTFGSPPAAGTGPAMAMVGVERFELPALWSQTRCATRLRYTPTLLYYPHYSYFSSLLHMQNWFYFI